MNIAQTIILILAFIGAFGFTAKSIYHMYHIITNITGKHASFLAPFILLMPSQFNKVGNQHRIKLFPAILGVLICWVVLILVKENTNA